MASYLHIPRPRLTRYDARLAAGVRVFDPEELIGQAPAKLPVETLDERGAGCGAIEPRGRRGISVEQRLDLDVGPRLQLEYALFGIRRVVGTKCALDVDGMGVVTLDQVAVVAVHRAHQGADLCPHSRMELPGEPVCLCGQIDRQVFETAPAEAAG
jgi:hypothetical protein